MSFFPFITVDNIDSTTNTLSPYCEFEWDFVNNEPIINNGDFVIIEGLEALKVWVYKALLVPRFNYDIYTWDYGSEVESLIGKAYTQNLTQSEVDRYIKEALSTHEYILDVETSDIYFDNNTLHATINLDTVYGGDTLNV